MLDFDLKLQTLQAVIDGALGAAFDRDVTVNLLMGLATSSEDPAVARRALFVLAQTRDPKARSVIIELAETGEPAIRLFAIQQLGLFGGAEARKPLLEIYGRADADAKRQVLRSLLVRSDRPALAEIAKRESMGRLRDLAIHQLGMLGGRDDLWALYQAKVPGTPPAIVQGLFMSGGRAELQRIAKGDADAKVRELAAGRLALLDGKLPGGMTRQVLERLQRDMERLQRNLEREAEDAEREITGRRRPDKKPPAPRP